MKPDQPTKPQKTKPSIPSRRLMSHTPSWLLTYDHLLKTNLSNIRYTPKHHYDSPTTTIPHNRITYTRLGKETSPPTAHTTNNHLQYPPRNLPLAQQKTTTKAPRNTYPPHRLGSWPSRDPIGENGGANLYAFCYNDIFNFFDVLGGKPVGVNKQHFDSGWVLVDIYKEGRDYFKTILNCCFKDVYERDVKKHKRTRYDMVDYEDREAHDEAKKEKEELKKKSDELFGTARGLAAAAALKYATAFILGWTPAAVASPFFTGQAIALSGAASLTFIEAGNIGDQAAAIEIPEIIKETKKENLDIKFKTTPGRWKKIDSLVFVHTGACDLHGWSPVYRK